MVARRPTAGALEAVQLAAVERGDREDDEGECVVLFLHPHSTLGDVTTIQPRPSTDPAELAGKAIELLAPRLPGLADAGGDAPARALYDVAADALRGLGESDAFVEFAANPVNSGLVRRLLQGAARDDAGLAERLAGAVAAVPQQPPTWHQEVTRGGAAPAASRPDFRVPAPVTGQRKGPSGSVLVAAFVAVSLCFLALLPWVSTWNSVVLLILLAALAAVVVNVMSDKLADWAFEPFMRRAREKAGTPIQDPETGVEHVPWQHRPLSRQATLILLPAAVVGLALLRLWLG